MFLLPQLELHAPHLSVRTVDPLILAIVDVLEHPRVITLILFFLKTWFS
jgi:hypothetical protein